MKLVRSGDRCKSDATYSRLDDRGYIMVVLLIGMAVAAVWMGALLPSWRQQAIREKEEELVFRGEQWAGAIQRYQSKNGSYPPNLDILVSQHYIRKKYLDPMTGKDFVPIGGIGIQGGRGGITAVRSTSTDPAIRIYVMGESSYSLFTFEDGYRAKMGGAVGGLPVGGIDGRGTGGSVGSTPTGGPGQGGRGTGFNNPAGGAIGNTGTFGGPGATRLGTTGPGTTGPGTTSPGTMSPGRGR